MVVGTEGTKLIKLQSKKSVKKNIFLVFRGLVHLNHFSFDGHCHLHFLCIRVFAADPRLCTTWPGLVSLHVSAFAALWDVTGVSQEAAGTSLGVG